jgi:hypothetical protein
MPAHPTTAALIRFSLGNLTTVMIQRAHGSTPEGRDTAGGGAGGRARAGLLRLPNPRMRRA